MVDTRGTEPYSSGLTGAMIITAIEAASLVRPGSTVMFGGFGLVGSPLSVVEALIQADHVHDLTTISNNVGEQGRGLGNLLNAGKISKSIGSYFTSNPDVVERYNRGELEARLIPQGTLAEAIRAGGAGIGGFYTKTGVGSDLAEGKEVRTIDGEDYVFESPLRADLAIIRAHRADTLGNLMYYKTARNFNPEMATAAEVVIAEVDKIVEVGELDPESIVTPHPYVDYLVKAHITLNDSDAPSGSRKE